MDEDDFVDSRELEHASKADDTYNLRQTRCRSSLDSNCTSQKVISLQLSQPSLAIVPFSVLPLGKMVHRDCSMFMLLHCYIIFFFELLYHHLVPLLSTVDRNLFQQLLDLQTLTIQAISNCDK